MASELLEHFYGALTGRQHTDESSQFVVLLSALADYRARHRRVA